jgi:hypothetical protein
MYLRVKRRWLLGTVCLIYVSSFLLPVYRAAPGWFAFIVTLTGLRFEGQGSSFSPVWLANPVLWIGVLLLATGRAGAAGIAGVVAVLLALLPMLHGSEEHLLIGYYAWLLSMAVLASSLVIRRDQADQSAGPESQDADTEDLVRPEP